VRQDVLQQDGIWNEQANLLLFDHSVHRHTSATKLIPPGFITSSDPFSLPAQKGLVFGLWPGCAHVVAYLACHKLGYHYKSKNQFGDGLVPGKNDHLSFHLQQWLWHLEVGWMPWYSFFHLHINGHLCVTVTHLFASLELLMAAKKKERYISDPSDAAVKVLKDDQPCQNCHQRKGTRADKYIVDLICPVTKRHT